MATKKKKTKKKVTKKAVRKVSKKATRKPAKRLTKKATARAKARKPSTRWHKKFLDALKKTRHVGQACQVAGVARRTAYTHRKAFPKFEEAWYSAFESCIDDLEESALKRAIHGYEKENYFQGVYCGSTRTHETVLTIFMLKAHRPDKYNFDSNAGEILNASQAAEAIRKAVVAMDDTIPLTDG